VKVTINGESREAAVGTTVLSLLTELGLHPQGTIVERNREIVDREAYPETHLAEGDVLELVRLVGGG
jgi:sulfur carrier protein